MDWFEVLFILLFILFPILEGVAKRRRQTGQPGNGSARPTPGGDRDRETVGSATSEQVPAGVGQEREPASAADMVPDDLWELLTGEKRGGTLPRPEQSAPTPAWSEPPATAPELPSSETRDPFAPAESLEYIGPEAYSLETPPPPPDVRHAAFHADLEEGRLPGRRRGPGAASRFRRVLHSPERLRSAVVLAEVLGKPRGLD